MARKILIKVRRDTTENWERINPVLAAGEPGLDITTGIVRWGNGQDPYTLLPVQGVTEPEMYIKEIAYNDDGLPEYIGEAQPGSDVGDDVWRIKKIIYDGSDPVQILFANEVKTFTNTWTSRESYTYG